MAATIATARGIDSTRVKETHRLGSRAAEATVATWRTFVTVTVNRSGAYVVVVKRDGAIIDTMGGEPE